MEQVSQFRRRRLEAMLAHRPAVLCDYLAGRQADEALRQALGLESEAELLDYLGTDFFYIPGRDISQNEGYTLYYRHTLPMDEKTRRCPLGILWHRGAGLGKFSVDETIEGPLTTAATAKDILAHPFPTPADFDFERLLPQVRAAGRLRVGGLWTGIMGDAYRMYGFERFLTDMALRPHLVRTLVDRLTEMYLALNDAYFTALRGSLDIWFFGNDFGSQTGMLMSPGMWADFFFQPIRALCRLAHGHGLAVMMHSCGGIEPIIPQLVEAGVDILDPVQTTARGMDAAVLSRRHGPGIVFHGGVDTQQLLPAGTPLEVENQAALLLDTFAPHGYIFAPSQVLGADIPTENILAMYRAYARWTDGNPTLAGPGTLPKGGVADAAVP